MILYRPVGLQEVESIYDSGMKAFPARLPKQPIFYPVLQLEYARQIASNWNAESGESAGYVTQFNIEDKYIKKFEKHAVRGTQYQEFWIQADDMEKFNKHIVGHIKVLEAHFGDAFQGFIPEKFALQGKNAVDQFTELANSYLYKRMDFFLEIRRNHKAVFLNYPFWQQYEFKNPGLKEKIIKAIKEAWLASFPQIPLPSPLATPSDSLEDITPEEQDDSYERPSAKPVPEKVKPIKQTYADSLVKPVRENPTPVEPSTTSTQAKPPAERLDDPDQEDSAPEEQVDAPANKQRLANSVNEKFPPLRRPYADSMQTPDEDEFPPEEQTNAHAQHLQGVKLGLSGNYQEAIAELSKAVAEDSEDVAAHTSRGVAFHRLGQDDRALACYEAALKIDPIYAEAHYFRANLLYQRGSVREAIAGYTVAMGLKPELIEAHQGPIPEDRLTDYSSSPAEMVWIAKPAYRILDLNKRIESNPRQANLFKRRAVEYVRLRNYAQAIADYSSSLELQPEDASAFYARGVAYEALGQNERAREDYQRALAINPQLAKEYFQRGVTFGQTGNFQQSIASLSDGLRLVPKNPVGYFNRGVSYFQIGDLEHAIEDFSTVIRLSPTDEAAYYWRGISYEEGGRQPEATADYRQFLALSQDETIRSEVEARLMQWKEADRNTIVPNEGQQTNNLETEKPAQQLDLYGLVAALGERALTSTWFGSGLECYGETAEELYALTEQNSPIEGRDFLRIASGIQQTIAGDFQAFEPDIATPWIFIRAWEGNGFYIETDDTQIEQQLKTQFPAMEEVEGAQPPYAGLFLRV